MDANQSFGLALSAFFILSAGIFYFFKWGNASGTSFERGCNQAVKLVLGLASLGLGYLCMSETFKDIAFNRLIAVIFVSLLTAMTLWSVYVYHNKKIPT